MTTTTTNVAIRLITLLFAVLRCMKDACIANLTPPSLITKNFFYMIVDLLNVILFRLIDEGMRFSIKSLIRSPMVVVE